MGAVIASQRCSEGGNEGGQDRHKRNKAIENMLQKERNSENMTVKLLLLGAAESGKSTFAKQMRILHQDGFSPEERVQFKHIIQTGILQAMVDILDICRTLFTDMAQKDPQFLVDAQKIGLYRDMVERENAEMNAEVADIVRRLWGDGQIQQCVTRGEEYHLSDAIPYFITRLEVICSTDYLPTDQDILHVRLKTVGVIETRFSAKGYNIRLVDVGGQRCERRKWIHCFDNVTAIIFTAAISEYDQVMAEDHTTNRMHESIQLFGSICNNQYFLHTSMILFLNKKDIFEVKILTSQINTCFPEYKGDNSYESTTDFIRAKYESVKIVKRKEIYSHMTNATDTTNIQFVFDATIAVVLKKNLERAGMF